MRFLKFAALFLLASAVWAAIALVLGFYGVWMTPVVPTGEHAAFHQWATDELHRSNRGSAALVSIRDGRISGEYYQPESEIDGETLFPSASFSKFITALAVVSLSERGLIDLDAPVSHYLTRWQLPESDFDNDGVTIRRLLSHTAGLTDGLGFGDYMADEELPSTEASLHAPRSSQGEKVIRVGIEPGSEFSYSGGGYLILELLVEEVTGTSFADHIRRTILDPLGMERSTYAYLAGQSNASPSYAVDGSIAPSYQYASRAATGFNTTALDLSRLAQAILTEEGPFSRSMMMSMRAPEGFLMGAGIWGMGTILYAPTESGDVLFGHDGGNDPAINATLRINPDNGDALIVLVSGHASLASAIGAEWVLWQTGYPDVLSTSRVLSSAALPIAIGVMVLLILLLLVARRTRVR